MVDPITASCTCPIHQRTVRRGTSSSYTESWPYLDTEFNIHIPMDISRQWVRGMQGFRVLKAIPIEVE
jgi:hypothetical protein